jgi:hypothetical protein
MIFFVKQYGTPETTDSWAKAVSNVDSYSRRYSTTKIAKFQLYFTAMGQARSPMALFCYTVALTAVTKAETFLLRAVQKKLRDSALCCIAWSLKKSFICDTHYTT